MRIILNHSSMVPIYEQLMEQIEHFDEKDYQKRCKEFCDMLGFYDDGHASKAVVDLILEKMNV